MLDLLSIMLVFIDLLARTVLLPIELLLFALGQVTIVSSHIGLLLVLDMLFAVFPARCLSRRHGAVFFAVRDAVLLVRLATIDFIHARMSRIDLPRSRAGCVAVLGLSRSSTGEHQTTHCQD